MLPAFIFYLFRVEWLIKSCMQKLLGICIIPHGILLGIAGRCWNQFCPLHAIQLVCLGQGLECVSVRSIIVSQVQELSTKICTHYLRERALI